MNNEKINSNGKVNVVTTHKTVIDEEFPLLGADDNKHKNSELERVLSPSSTTSSATLNMAETLLHGSPRSHTPSQLAVNTQKLEELALKKSRLLIPMTPSTPRSTASNSFEKSKVKTEQLQYPFSPNHSLHGSHPNSHIQKNTTTASTPINSPSKSSSNSTPSAWITMEKRPIQTQSRSDFLKNLSRKSSSKDISCDLEKSDVCTKNDTSCLTLKSRDASSMDDSNLNSATEHNSNITPSQYSGTDSILNSEEEEIAFLRSLGWDENSKDDDEGLTEEEIQEFYEKYGKLKQ